MKTQLESLQEALEFDQSHLLEDVERKKRWEWLTDGIRGDYSRVCTEILLDNQIKASKRPKSMFEDAITTTQSPAFTTFSLPIIRRVFPNLIAQNLVSVQPMSQPTGKIFYFDITYAGVGSPVDYPRVDDFDNFSDTYSEAAELEQVPQLNLKLTDTQMEAKSKKLMYEISAEAFQDLDAYFSLNADTEMTNAISAQIARETDSDIISDLYAGAIANGAGNVNWDANVPALAPWTTLNPREWYRTLYDAIVDGAKEVYKKRYRVPNWIVVGPDNAAILEKTDEFRLAPGDSGSDNPGTIIAGPHLFGTLSNKFSVWQMPWLKEAYKDIILIGYKGGNAFEAGYVYSPFIGAYLTSVVEDPSHMSHQRGIMSRYGKKMLVPEMYATVTVTPKT